MFLILPGNNKKSLTGFMLLEILVAIALITIVFVVLLSIVFSAATISSSIKKEIQANTLAQAEFEALRNYRDGTTWTTNGLGTVNTGSSNPYYLVNSSGSWALVSGQETTGIFTRKIIFDKVSRDPATQNIESVYNPLNNDNDTVKVAITVSWPGKTIQDVSYFTNWKND